MKKHTRKKVRSSNISAASIAVFFAIVFSGLALWLHWVNIGDSAQVITSGPSSSGLSIRISGNHFVNASGKTVQLTGVDRMIGCSDHLFDGPANQAEVTAMKNYGINAVRLSTMYEGCWLGLHNEPAHFSVDDYRNAVINYVNLLNKNGIYAIVDLHLNNPEPYTYHAQQVMADKDHAYAYWASVANTFKNNPAVIFEAYNEPHITASDTNATDIWKCWRDGCTANVVNESYSGPKFSHSWQTAGMQQIVNTIRGTGAKNVISLGGLSFSNSLGGILKKDSAGKAYLPADSNHQLAISFHNYKGWGCGTASCWNSTVLPVARQMPVITTEFGEHDCKTDFLKTWFPWADANGISYTAWVWTPGTCDGNVKGADAGAWGLLSNWNGTANTYGAYTLDHIQQHAKTPPTPVTKITSPGSGVTVKGTVTVSASATVTSGTITKLVIVAGGTTLKTCTSGSCGVSWDTTKISNGAKTISATSTASDGKSSSSSESVTVNNVPPPPSVPVNITSPAQTTSTISLNWSASTDTKYPSSQLSYHVYRNGAKVGNTAAGVTTYTDKSLAAGTYYSYTITASDPAARTSAQSTAFTQNTKTPNCAKPDAPARLTGNATSATSVSLHWDPVSNPSSQCVILHYVISRDRVPLASPGAASYVDNSAVASTTYTYTVLAVETGNIAGQSTSISVTTPKPAVNDPGPSAPSAVKGSAVSTSQINLSWNASTDNVAGIKRYDIMRDGSQIGSSTTTSFGDSGLNENTAYKYQVVAVSGGDKTASSSIVSVTTLKNSSGTPGGGGGQGGGGSNGGSSGNSTGIPVLKNTHSVGTGSDTGTSSSQNPTSDAGKTDNGSTTVHGPLPPAKQSHIFRNVAYVFTGLIIVAIIAGLVMSLRRRKQLNSYVAPLDTDMTAQPPEIIKPAESDKPDDKKNNDGNHDSF